MSPLADSCQLRPGLFTWTRTGPICQADTIATYTLIDDKSKPIGTGTMSVNSSNQFSASSLTWSESITLTVTQTTGQVKSLNVAFDVGCTSSCSAPSNKPWTGIKTLAAGQSATGSVTYKSSVPSGTHDSFDTQYHIYVVSSGAVPIQPNLNWGSPPEAKIRCDAEFTTSGCVIPERRAYSSFSLSDPKHASAAAAYAWAQNNLRGGAPLRRVASETVAVANRERTCGAKSSDPFVAMPNQVPDDSCDEFPFAGTYEGGTDGALCADIVPKLEGGQWKFYAARTDKPVKGTEPCIRAHVSSTANSSAGGVYGSMVKNQRVLDTEKFDIVVTN